MKLEQEIAIIQFAQGIYSAAELLDQFIQVEGDENEIASFELFFLLKRFKPLDSDIEQSISDSSLDPNDPLCTDLRKSGVRVWHGLDGFLSSDKDEKEKAYKLLLALLKTAYQRRYTLKKDNSIHWWYWDLSQREIAQKIVTDHQELMEEVYTDVGFRSEFVCLAKLWNTDRRVTDEPEPAKELSGPYNFLSYDELVTVCVIGSFKNYKKTHSISLLLDSLINALSARYKIDSEWANRVVLGVVERHLQETYNTGLY